MPTSLFQYEMLPTTWFYLSSLLIGAVFFRFNRLFSVRNIDVAALISLTPGLVYVAMGSAFQGYLWLWFVGVLIFGRLIFDVFLRRRPLLEPNLNFSGLAFSCVAASAFIIPNLFLNRGDACESPRAWRLEQILTAAEEADPDVFTVENWPGYRPFLEATQKVNRFFAPSQESWRRATTELRARQRGAQFAEIFGVSIRVDGDNSKRRSATRAMQWAAGLTDGRAFDFEDDGSERNNAGFGGVKRRSSDFPNNVNGLQAAQTIPAAPVAPSVNERVEGSVISSQVLPQASSESTTISVSSDLNVSENNAEKTDELEVGVGGANGFSWQPLSYEDAFLIMFVAALQLGLVVSIIMIGRVHFGSLQTGLACGLLYLLLPYINQFSARLDHIVPALAILLAILFYRRPVLSGLALGVAGSLVFYPFFLLPLWIGFYWKKGLTRFILGVSSITLTFAVALLFSYEPNSSSYGQELAAMFGRYSLFLAEADGLWEYLPRFYRIPLISLFVVFSFGYALWLPRKNLATLISCSAALLLAVQFWTGRQGGLYMAWYLPLIVLTVFRPNLDDRTAINIVVDV